MKRKLHKHQVDMIHYLRQNNKGALFVEMRLGKTLPVIRRLKGLIRFRLPMKFLIVVPNSALFSWVRELKLEGENSMDLLQGLSKQRLKLLSKNSKWNLINKEGFLALPEISDIKWDALILDESTFIKNPKTKVTKFFCNRFRDIPYKYILTGLPAPESELNYFCQLYFLDPDILNCENFWKFRLKYFRVGFHDWKITPKGKRFLSDRIKENAFVLNRKDVKLNKKKVYESRYITMPDKIQKIYNKVEDEFILEYKNKQKLTKYAMTKFHWLRQLTSGIVNNKFIWDGKIQETLYLLKNELKDEQVVIWCNYVDEIRYLADSLLKNKIALGLICGKIKNKDRFKMFKSFNKKDVRVLVCEVHCGLFGTDFSAADTAIYYSNPLGYETRVQSEDRILSSSKNAPLLYLDILVRDSIDEHILESLMKKESRNKLFMRLIHDKN